jgi:hypothetical protein
MRTMLIAQASGAAIFVLALASSGQAQTSCPEGRTLSGQCVKPRLGQSISSQVIALSQPKASYSAPPGLPSEDRATPTPLHTHEAYNLFTGPPVDTPVAIVTIPAGLGPARSFVVRRP